MEQGQALGAHRMTTFMPTLYPTAVVDQHEAEFAEDRRVEVGRTHGRTAR